MARLAIALPILPGGAERLKAKAAELSGDRRADFDDFHRRVGLVRESWFLQQTPQGDMTLIVLEGDPMGAMKKLGQSDHPFDVEFREWAKTVHGVDFAQPMPGPPPELVFEG